MVIKLETGFVLFCTVFWYRAASQAPVLSLEKSQKGMKLDCKYSSKTIQWWKQNETLFEIGFFQEACMSTSEIPWYMDCDCISPIYSCRFETNATTIGILNNTIWKCSADINGVDIPSDDISMVIEASQAPVLSLEKSQKGLKLDCKYSSKTVQWWKQNETLFEIGFFQEACISTIAIPWYMDCDCISPIYSCRFEINATTIDILNNTIWKCSAVINGFDISSDEISMVIEEPKKPALSQVQTQRGQQLICYHNSGTVQWWHQNSTLFLISSVKGSCVSTHTLPWYMDCDCIAPNYTCDLNITALSTPLLNNTIWKCSVFLYGTDVYSEEITMLITDKTLTESSDNQNPSAGLSEPIIIVLAVVIPIVIGVTAAVVFCKCFKGKTSNLSSKQKKNASEDYLLNDVAERNERNGHYNDVITGTNQHEEHFSKAWINELNGHSNNPLRIKNKQDGQSNNVVTGINVQEQNYNIRATLTNEQECHSNNVVTGPIRQNGHSDQVMTGKTEQNGHSDQVMTGKTEQKGHSEQVMTRKTKKKGHSERTGTENLANKSVLSGNLTNNPAQITESPGKGTGNPGETTVTSENGMVNPRETIAPSTQETDNPIETTVSSENGTGSPAEALVPTAQGKCNPIESTLSSGTGTENPVQTTVLSGMGTDNPAKITVTSKQRTDTQEETAVPSGKITKTPVETAILSGKGNDTQVETTVPSGKGTGNQIEKNRVIGKGNGN